MSRILWWVQDQEEIDFVKSRNGVIRIPPTHSQDPKKDDSIGKSNPPYTELRLSLIDDWLSLIEKRKKFTLLGLSRGDLCTNDEFLTLFDSCYNFVCDVDEEEIDRLGNIVTSLSKEPMKSSVWKPRAYHHVKLIIDGLCKQRCLFRDYDSSFNPVEEDYDLAERILIRMVNGWDTNLQPKEEI